MPAAAGKDMILKTGIGTTVIVAALRSTSLSVNGQMVEVTSRDSAGMRELLAGAGIVAVSIQADAVVTNNVQVTDFITKTTAQTIDPYTIVFSNGDTMTGNFQCVKFDIKGDYKSEQLYSLSLESSGAVTLTPVP